MSLQPKFSKQSLSFLLKAARQKRPDWLERNREEYERVLLDPLKHFAAVLKKELAPHAPGYHFPQKGIGRLKRPADRAKECGLYRDWMTYSAARPRASRFEHNPNLFFLLNPDDRDDPVLIAGGLYMPSSKQMRAIRESIANDASAFDALFKAREFSSRFKGGFAREKIASRPPRGFDPNHPRMDWLKLQGFYVWKGYSMKEFSSPKFAQLVAKDFRQILLLNRLLDQAVAGKLALGAQAGKKKSARALDLSDRLESMQAPRRQMDF